MLGAEGFTYPCPGVGNVGEICMQGFPHATSTSMARAARDLQTSVSWESAATSLSLVEEEVLVNKEVSCDGFALEQGRQGSTPRSQADVSDMASLLAWNDGSDEGADGERGRPADRREKKRISNRESARRMRQLRQRQLAALHLQVIGLEKANKQLLVETSQQKALLLHTVPSLVKNCKRLMEDKERLTLALENMQSAWQESLLEQSTSTPLPLSMDAQNFARMVAAPVRRCTSLHDSHSMFRGQLAGPGIHNLTPRTFSAGPDIDDAPEFAAAVSCPPPLPDMRADANFGRAMSWAGPSSHMGCPVGLQHVPHPCDPSQLPDDLLAMLSQNHFGSLSAEVLDQAGPVR